MHQKISAHVDGGPSGGSSVHRHGREDPHHVSGNYDLKIQFIEKFCRLVLVYFLHIIYMLMAILFFQFPMNMGNFCITKVAPAGEVLKLHYKEVSGNYLFDCMLCFILYSIFLVSTKAQLGFVCPYFYQILFCVVVVVSNHNSWALVENTA